MKICACCCKELPQDHLKPFCHDECEDQYWDMKFAAEESGCFS